MNHIVSKNTLPRLSSRVFLAIALFLGTLAVTQVSNAQSPVLISDLQHVTGSASTSATFLMSIVTSSELANAVLLESGSFNNTAVTTGSYAGDISFILTTMPATTSVKTNPPPSDANFYPSLIANIFGPGAVNSTLLGSSTTGAAYAFMSAIAGNSKLYGAIGGDGGLLDLAYYGGIDLNEASADGATGPMAAAIAKYIESVSQLTYYQTEIGIYAAYEAAGIKNPNDPGVVPNVAKGIAFQPVGANYTPTASGEAGLAAAVGGAYGQLLQSSTLAEFYTLNQIGLSGSAPQVAGIYATAFLKSATAVPAIAGQASSQYNSEAPLIAGAVANADPGLSGTIAVDALLNSGTQYAAAIAYDVVTAPSYPVDLKTPDATRIAVDQDVTAYAPLQAPAITGTVAPTLVADADRSSLAYVVADQLGGLEAIDGVTLSSSTYLNEIPAATQGIEASIPANDSLEAYYAAQVSEYAAYPIWLAQFGTSKIPAVPAFANTPAILYTDIALDGAEAQVSGSNLTPTIQAAVAGGVNALFSSSTSTAITTATAVEENALAEGGTGNAPYVVGVFASNTVLGPEARYLAAQNAVQFAANPTDVILGSGSAAVAQPAQAPVIGFQVAVVTATSNYSAVATELSTVATSEGIREVIAQDMIDANPSADTAGAIDAVISGAVGAKLTSDLDRETLAFLIGDEEAGVDGYFTPPTGGTVLAIPQNVAAVAGVLASEETATGAQLVSDEELMGVYAAYCLSALDTGKHGNSNPTPDEIYIPGIADAVVAAQVSGSNLPITTEASINTTMVNDYGTELSGSVGTLTLNLDLGTTLTQSGSTSAPTVAFYYAQGLYGTASTYANPIATKAATGENPYLSGSIAAGYAQNDVLGSVLLGTTNGHTISGTASLQRLVGQHVSVQLGYTRLRQDYSGVPVLAATPNTNREFVSISYHFSRPLGR